MVKEYTEEVFAEVAASWSLQGLPPPPPQGLQMAGWDDSVARAVQRGHRRGGGGAARNAANSVPQPATQGDITELAQRVAVELETRSLHVQCISEDRWHIAASWGIAVAAPTWRTRCGWHFARGRNYHCTRAEPPPGATRCEKCHGSAPMAR